MQTIAHTATAEDFRMKYTLVGLVIIALGGSLGV